MWDKTLQLRTLANANKTEFPDRTENQLYILMYRLTCPLILQLFIEDAPSPVPICPTTYLQLRLQLIFVSHYTSTPPIDQPL